MSIPAIIVLAAAAGFFGALAEHLAGVLFHSAFLARMAGLMVAALFVLAGSAGTIALRL